MSTMDLFGGGGESPPRREERPLRSAPLAERMRPHSLDEVIGQERLTGEAGLLRAVVERKQVPSLIFWGPPGTGKTTLARIIAREAGLPFEPFSAVTGGVKEVRELVGQARERLKRTGKATILFVDEIHRFNKAQQDAFLPHVEEGVIILLGATTENPSFELNSALLSRVQVVVLEPLPADQVQGLLERALADAERGLGEWELGADPEVLEAIARRSFGDVRRALNRLEAAANLARGEGKKRIEWEVLERAMRAAPLRYDKAGEEHYNIISAFIKSLRGSDPDAALYWLARMLETGENPRFIARRMMIFASEDVGNADPRALMIAGAVAQAVEFVGLPEARINLAQGVTYLALAPKSNASYAALNAAQAEVKRSGSLPVPHHLRNAPTGLMKELGYGKGYEYAHSHEGAESEQAHLPEQLAGTEFYAPTDRGFEERMAERLKHLRELRAKRRSKKS